MNNSVSPSSSSSSCEVSGSEAKHSKNKPSNICGQQVNGSAKPSVCHQNNLRSEVITGGASNAPLPNNKKNKNNCSNNSSRDSSTPARDDSITIIKLENELKKARSDLNATRQSEQELRNQMNCLVGEQKRSQQEYTQLKSENDSLQSKVQSLVASRQSDRLTMERRVNEERRGRQSVESQLQTMDRKLKKMEVEQQQQRHQQNAK